jgi:streptogramin lyase
MKLRTALATLAALGVLLASAACAGKQQSKPPVAGPTLPARVSAVIPTDHGPNGFIVAQDGIYLGNHRGGSIQRIDPATNRVVSTILVGGQMNLPFTADPNVPLWVCTNVDGVLHQVDLSTGRVAASLQADCNGGWRSVIDGLVWATAGEDTHVLQVIDAKTGQVLKTNPIELGGAPVLAGDRVLIGSGPSGKTYQFALDGTPMAPLMIDTEWLTPAGGKLYRIPMDGQLAELDPVTLAPLHTYTVPKHEDGDPSLVADDSGHLYYRPEYMKVYRIDTATGAVDLFLQTPWEEVPTAMAWAFGSLWISNFDDDTVWRVNTAM